MSKKIDATQKKQRRTCWRVDRPYAKSNQLASNIFYVIPVILVRVIIFVTLKVYCYITLSFRTSVGLRFYLQLFYEFVDYVYLVSRCPWSMVRILLVLVVAGIEGFVVTNAKNHKFRFMLPQNL
jgi:hypothetical protein